MHLTAKRAVIALGSRMLKETLINNHISVFKRSKLVLKEFPIIVVESVTFVVDCEHINCVHDNRRS